MPKREDDYWASQKEGLRYCSKHKRYFRADVGCQLCGYEKSERGRGMEGSQRLERCPACGDVSLFWNEQNDLYECLNLRCKRRFTKNELAKPLHWEAESGKYAPYEKDKYSEFKPVYEPPIRKPSQPRRSRISLTVLPIFLLAIASIVIVFYAISNFDQVDRPIAFGIISAAGVTAIWNMITLRKLWKYRPRTASFGRIFFSLIFLALIGSTAAAYTGVAPLDVTKDKVIEFFKDLSQDRGTSAPAVVTPKTTPLETRGGVISTPPRVIATPSSKSIDQAQLELLIYQKVNEQRRKYGLPPLTYDEKLASIARAHSEDMAKFDYFSHTNRAGDDPSARAARQGYVLRKDYGSYYTTGIAENLFQDWLYSSITYIGPVPVKNRSSMEEIAQRVVDGWMDSPGHRANILERLYDRQGIGVAVSSDEKVLVTQDFW